VIWHDFLFSKNTGKYVTRESYNIASLYLVYEKDNFQEAIYLFPSVSFFFLCIYSLSKAFNSKKYLVYHLIVYFHPCMYIYHCFSVSKLHIVSFVRIYPFCIPRNGLNIFTYLIKQNRGVSICVMLAYKAHIETRWEVKI